MFDELQANIRAEVVNAIYHLQIRQQAPPPPPPTEAAFATSSNSQPAPAKPETNGAAAQDGAAGQNGAVRRARAAAAANAASHGARVVAGKVGRNDPCPCGSGKKY